METKKRASALELAGDLEALERAVAIVEEAARGWFPTSRPKGWRDQRAQGVYAWLAQSFRAHGLQANDLGMLARAMGSSAARAARRPNMEACFGSSEESEGFALGWGRAGPARPDAAALERAWEVVALLEERLDLGPPNAASKRWWRSLSTGIERARAQKGQALALEQARELAEHARASVSPRRARL